MPNEIWAAVIGVLGTIGGVVFGARLSRQAAQDLLGQQARAELFAAFTSTLVKLHLEIDNPGEGRAEQRLQEDYPSHFTAYLKLRAVIRKEQRSAVEDAWKRYAENDEYELQEERACYRFSHVLGPDTDEHQRMLAIKHINTLLKALAT